MFDEVESINFDAHVTTTTSKNGAVEETDEEDLTLGGVRLEYMESMIPCKAEPDDNLMLGFSIICDPKATTPQHIEVKNNSEDPCEIDIQFEHKSGCAIVNFGSILKFLGVALLVFGILLLRSP